MRIKIVTAALFALMTSSLAPPAAARENESTSKPTIILVHGAFAGSSSWAGVVNDLLADGYPVIAAANPLRSVRGDAAYVASIVSSLTGPVVLVGHSYGGEVISVAAVGHANVKALVFVAGLAPDIGESAASLGQKFPTGTLGQALAAPVPLPDGNSDLYIEQSHYWHQFAADVPKADAVVLAATQRPIVKAALAEAVTSQSWHDIPSWFVWGSLDLNIPAALHAFMARRAAAREAVEIKGGSHVVMISHPRDVADLIEHAARVP